MYRYKHENTKQKYHQFEAGKIISMPEKTCKVMVKFGDDEFAYPVTLNKVTWVHEARHIPKKQYKWRLLKLKAFAVKSEKE